MEKVIVTLNEKEWALVGACILSEINRADKNYNEITTVKKLLENLDIETGDILLKAMSNARDNKIAMRNLYDTFCDNSEFTK